MTDRISPPGQERFNVGGVMCDRPFRIQRLGHFGLNFRDLAGALDFYREHFGVKVADTFDLASLHRDSPEISACKESHAYFTRIGADHHAFVLMPDRIRRLIYKDMPADMTINQITWQVGSLREVVEAADWLEARKIPIVRRGRDTPGSNWHVYPIDPDRHVVELFYGIEQIGWDGLSKPLSLHRFGARRPPQIPRMPEYLEIAEVVREGEDLTVGTRSLETAEPKHDVSGIMLPRPYRVVGVGPVGLFVADVERSVGFYTEICGLTVTRRVEWNGHTVVYLRAGSEHHTLALYPKALRDELGWSSHTSCMSFGMRVNDYAQLRAAVFHLRQAGVEIRQLPPELTAGIDYSVFAIDPEGHAIQLYFCMDSVGPDGQLRQAPAAAPGPFDDWPETLDYAPHMFKGEVFLGPWG